MESLRYWERHFHVDYISIDEDVFDELSHCKVVERRTRNGSLKLPCCLGAMIDRLTEERQHRQILSTKNSQPLASSKFDIGLFSQDQNIFLIHCISEHLNLKNFGKDSTRNTKIAILFEKCTSGHHNS